MCALFAYYLKFKQNYAKLRLIVKNCQLCNMTLFHFGSMRPLKSFRSQFSLWSKVKVLKKRMKVTIGANHRLTCSFVHSHTFCRSFFLLMETLCLLKSLCKFQATIEKFHQWQRLERMNESWTVQTIESFIHPFVHIGSFSHSLCCFGPWTYVVIL